MLFCLFMLVASTEGGKLATPRVPRPEPLDLNVSTDPNYVRRLQTARRCFEEWLCNQGLTLASIAVSGVILAHSLRAYGLFLWNTGAPRYIYVDAINGVLAEYDVWRNLMAPAWKVAKRWAERQPGKSRATVPRVLFKAMICLALLWGWPLFACNTALGFGGLLHPTEWLDNRRESLTLPSDALFSFEDAFLYIADPKTKRFARHQHSRIADPSIVAMLEVGFKHMSHDSPLWPYSKAAYRKCWNEVLRFLGVPHTVADGGPTPGSLRGSGATDLYMQKLDIPKIQWLGRWQRLQTLEYYLQEVAAKTLLPSLAKESRDRISILADAAASVVLSFVETGSAGLWTARVARLPGQTKRARTRGPRLQSDRLRRRQGN